MVAFMENIQRQNLTAIEEGTMYKTLLKIHKDFEKKYDPIGSSF